MTFNLTRFKITGEVTEEQILFCLQSHPFVDISDKGEERSIGFTSFFDMTDTNPSTIEQVKIDQFYVFGIRTDTRKVPGTVLGMEVKKASEAWLADHEGFRYIPKAEKEQIRESVFRRLLKNTIPVPSFVKVSWNTETGEVLIWSRSRAL